MSVRRAARRQLRRARHNALLLRADVAEVITVNDDFTDLLTDVRHWARTRHPLAIGVQEGKRTDYREVLGPRWGVRQRMRDDSTAGVAIIWDRDQAEPAGDTRDQPSRLGHGWRPLAHPGRGDDMLTRGIVWQDLELHTGGVFRKASTHRPSWRHRHHWARFDRQLEEWLAASPIPVVLSMDNNQLGGPDLDSQAWDWRGVGIDGHVSDVPILSTYELALRHSDHRAVSSAVDLSGLPR